MKDQNKVLRGGPWWYQQAPVIIQPYDGVRSLKNMVMSSLILGNSEGSSSTNPILNFASNTLFHSSFKFQGFQNASAVEKSPFAKLSVKPRRLVLLKKQPKDSNADCLALVPLQSEMHTKKLKQPDFLASLSAKVLRLVNEQNAIVLVSNNTQTTPSLDQKKKHGRLIG
ncbi:hypothetical protein ACLB2K_055172 [Fragaria x ananassa]